MGNITGNLSRYEFACRCRCGLSDPHPLLAVGIQDVVRVAKAHAVFITSGSRCHQHNAGLVKRGLAGPLSSHLPDEESGYTKAADCVFTRTPLSKVVAAAQGHPTFKDGGIGLYVDDTPRVHLDCRGTRARWGVVDGKKVSFLDALAELHKREKTP